MYLITRGLKSKLLVSRGYGFQSSPVEPPVSETVVGGNFKRTKRRAKIGKLTLKIRLIGKKKLKIDKKFKIIGFVKANKKLSIKVNANLIRKYSLSAFGLKNSKTKFTKPINGSKVIKNKDIFFSFGNLVTSDSLKLHLDGSKKNKNNKDFIISGIKSEKMNSKLFLSGIKQQKINKKFKMKGLDDPFKLEKNFTELQEIALMDID